MWRADRPALARAIDRSVRFLRGECTIEKYHYEKVFKAIRARLIKFQNPKFRKGDLATMHIMGKKSIVFCTSDVYITEKGEIANKWVCPDNTIREVSQDIPGKRL